MLVIYEIVTSEWSWGYVYMLGVYVVFVLFIVIYMAVTLSVIIFSAYIWP